MRVICLSGRVFASEPRSTFERAISIVRCRVVNLVAAINAGEYEIAWLAKLDLQHALNLAQCYAETAPNAERASSIARMLVIRNAVTRALAFAPDPSDAAIAQERSIDCWTERSDWRHEERQWLGKRAEEGSLVVFTASETLASSKREHLC